ncbi:hypothetical protein PtA15_7A705 [Puccinia triticina]|uniref:Uncharacterized protein n=1 Tax=Puccinia triticina TaxID=208348 RepID=A0ABY7CP02_9BASI|nr:uncharacterized protein PtA15_7A705 [Puccinia triticina]WAQ86976.1 hypothetical protein PtA15_7A705 [Puccinia triticina]
MLAENPKTSTSIGLRFSPLSTSFSDSSPQPTNSLFVCPAAATATVLDLSPSPLQ